MCEVSETFLIGTKGVRPLWIAFESICGLQIGEQGPVAPLLSH
jgi:hypothetical protein